MGNTVNISKEEFARTKPWLFDENVTIGKENTPLVFFVVKLGITSAFNVFIQRGFNFNMVDEFGNTPLHYAATKSGIFVQALVARGLDIMAHNAKGQTPLVIAVLNKRIKHIPILAGAMFIRDNDYMGPIHHAMKMKSDMKLDMVKELIRYTPALPSYWLLTYTEPVVYHLNYFANTESFPPMHLAVMTMDKTMVRLFLSMGGDMNSEYSGKTPKSILVQIGSTLRYGGIFPTDYCTRQEVMGMWAVLTKDTNVHRNVLAGANNHTGLLSGEYKCF